MSFDWLDGALFFRVFSEIPIEGVANLNARATTEQVAATASAPVTVSQTTGRTIC